VTRSVTPLLSFSRCADGDQGPHARRAPPSGPLSTPQRVASAAEGVRPLLSQRDTRQGAGLCERITLSILPARTLRPRTRPTDEGRSHRPNRSFGTLEAT
jgi:hypothetical protein